MARPAPSRPSSAAPTSSRPVSQQQSKEPAHLPLHRRLLFPTLPADKPLPVLVPGHGDDIALLNQRIYHLIALALRAYVLSWLPRITRDRSLLPHIHTTILAPILTPIFTTIANDPESLVPLVLHDVPGILTLHMKTYWAARDSSRLLDLEVDQAYHSILPLLSTEPAPKPGPSEPGRNPIPEGQYVVSGTWLTALSDSIARIYLPPEEYRIDVQRTMVREIIGRTVLGAVARRIVEGWFWYAIILRFLPYPKLLRKVKTTSVPELALGLLHSVIHWTLRLWSIGTWVAATLSAAPKTAEEAGAASSLLDLARVVLGVDGRLGKRNWALRMAWGVFEMIVFLSSPLVDRLLPHLVRVYLLTPTAALWLVNLLERILFPLDGYPAPQPPDLTPDEAAVLRRELEERLSMILPQAVRKVAMPEHTDLRALLDPISDAGCNAHLVGMLYNTIAGTLVPQLVIEPTNPKETDGDRDGEEEDNTATDAGSERLASSQEFEFDG